MSSYIDYLTLLYDENKTKNVKFELQLSLTPTKNISRAHSILIKLDSFDISNGYLNIQNIFIK